MIDAKKMMELNLKKTLIKLMKELFGSDIETRWMMCYFPFTHPSYELLKIKYQGEWMEILESGQSILEMEVSLIEFYIESDGPLV